MQLLDGAAQAQGKLDVVETAFSWATQVVQYSVKVIGTLFSEVFIVLSPETFLLGFQRTHDLIQTRDVVAANAHGLTHGLHGGGQGVISADKLLKGKAWSLDDDIVQGWLESRRRYTGDVVSNFIQGIADGKLRS